MKKTWMATFIAGIALVTAAQTTHAVSVPLKPATTAYAASQGKQSASVPAAKTAPSVTKPPVPAVRPNPMPAKAVPVKQSQSAVTQQTSVTKEQVLKWINAQAKQRIAPTQEFFFQAVNLDDDPELEIVAKFTGSVHIGTFYVMDLQSGSYKLIAEKDWNIPHFQLDRWDISRHDSSGWNHKDPQDIGKVAGKRLFEAINKTGGSGVDSYISHLWYVEKGVFYEAWNGVLQEISSVPGGKLIQTTGSYQIVENGGGAQIFSWQTTRELNPESMRPIATAAETSLHIYQFDGKKFTQPQAK